jgi:hypothetical protein
LTHHVFNIEALTVVIE